jgi:hypothetical protein
VPAASWGEHLLRLGRRRRDDPKVFRCRGEGASSRAASSVAVWIRPLSSKNWRTGSKAASGASKSPVLKPSAAASVTAAQSGSAPFCMLRELHRGRVHRRLRRPWRARPTGRARRTRRAAHRGSPTDVEMPPGWPRQPDLLQRCRDARQGLEERRADGHLRHRSSARAGRRPCLRMLLVEQRRDAVLLRQAPQAAVERTPADGEGRAHRGEERASCGPGGPKDAARRAAGQRGRAEEGERRRRAGDLRADLARERGRARNALGRELLCLGQRALLLRREPDLALLVAEQGRADVVDAELQALRHHRQDRTSPFTSAA